jgi:4-hydroxy-tetrahydrodipicolinate synthase
VRVRDAAGELTVLAYHFPKRYPAIPVEALGDLDVDGLKDSEGDAARLSDEAGSWDRAVYTGSVPLLADAGRFGATGAILALANLLPERCALALAGDQDSQAALRREHELIANHGVAAIKHALAREYGTPTHMRPARRSRVTA